jgi:CRP/FNR family cyclic AMP-dependent transcriptional regulator
LAQIPATINFPIVRFRTLLVKIQYRGSRAMAGKRRSPFNPTTFLAKVGVGRSIGRYSKNSIVFSQGDPADAVFYIQSGKAKVTVISEEGKEAVVAILGPDEFFGEGCLAGQPQRIATVRSIAESTIVRLEKTAIVDVIHQEPAFSEMFIDHLLGRTIRVEVAQRWCVRLCLPGAAGRSYSTEL